MVLEKSSGGHVVSGMIWLKRPLGTRKKLGKRAPADSKVGIKKVVKEWYGTIEQVGDLRSGGHHLQDPKSPVEIVGMTIHYTCKICENMTYILTASL